MDKLHAPPRVRLTRNVSLRHPHIIHSVNHDAGITLDDTLAQAGRRIMLWQAELIPADDWRLGATSGPLPAQVHHLRVSTRRLRTTWRAFKPYYKARAIQPIGKGLRDLAQALTPTRELDVALDVATRGDATTLQPLQLAWRAERETARDELANYLRSSVYLDWHQTFLDFVGSQEYDRAHETGQSHHVRHMLDALIAQGIADVRAHDTLPDPPALEDLHTLRIAVKRLRYLCEGLRDVLPAARAEQIIGACSTAQKAYGALVDARIVVTRGLAFVSQGRMQELDREAMRGILDFIQAHQQQVRVAQVYPPSR